MVEVPGFPKKLETLVINDDAEAPSLLDPTTGRLVITNSVGRRIIELADGKRDVAGIVEIITREFSGADRDSVAQHAEGFLAESAEKGLISWATPN